MSYSWARPGVKCVCIKQGAWVGTFTDVVGVGPSFNEICVVVAVARILGEKYLQLDGFPTYYSASRFRPLITKTQEQDVAIFAPLLNTSRVDA
jgi:hypothetical protein